VDTSRGYFNAKARHRIAPLAWIKRSRAAMRCRSSAPAASYPYVFWQKRAHRPQDLLLPSLFPRSLGKPFSRSFSTRRCPPLASLNRPVWQSAGLAAATLPSEFPPE
jgi:hypothetical protein